MAHPSNAAKQLAEVVRLAGPAAAVRKRELLSELCEVSVLAPRDLLALRDSLGFLRAFPDDAAVLKLAEGLCDRLLELTRQSLARHNSAWRLDNSGLPGSTHTFPYSYPVVLRLAQLAGFDVQLDAASFADECTLHEALAVLVSNGEGPALDDVEIETRDWTLGCAKDSDASELQVVLEVFEASSAPPAVRAELFEGAGVVVQHTLTGRDRSRLGARLDVGRVRYRRKAFEKERFALPGRIRRALPDTRDVQRSVARDWLDRLLLHFLARDIEIYPLTHANDRDVQLFTLGRGYHLLLAGVLPAKRCAIELSSIYVVLSNGVPIAYGPASPFLGCCEMGINFFEEYRGGDTRFIYAGVMSALHHAFGVERFFVTAYGMGKGNAAAIKTGAFWFYRKLGFSVDNPRVETLARAEEARMVADRGYRSDRTTLRKLSNTAAHLDLSGGRCQRFDSGALGLAVARARVGHRLGADGRDVARVRKALGIANLLSWTDAERAALHALAPVLARLVDLPRWDQRDRKALVRIIRAKGGHTERGVDRVMRAHPRLERELRALIAEN